MRRLEQVLLLTIVLEVSGCKRRDPIRLQETDESPLVLSSTLHMADPKASIQLLKGFHAVEQNAWRWTMGKFSVALKVPTAGERKGATLRVRFAIHDALIKAARSTTLTASVGATQVGSATYSQAGDYTFSTDVPSSLLTSEAVNADFALTHFLSGGAGDNRELGLILSSVELLPK